ncbi:uncharacterized protein YceK [Panacagrimonas perspica]|uniref:Uncharacterized protein YceK n=1 Tax=Panacagrimonas perspica TaxID=381431 RepID=A0A4R7NXV0_9GAMM|nr:YceK/YidQ family lipoprotein [Panacagrimonas perspica]TDU25541.1 uncharacterized protein YceK [Panacagrimonas perspica]
MTPRFAASLAAMLCIGLSGCATVRTADNAHVGSPKIYGGTRVNVAALSDDETSLSRYRQYGIEAPAYPAADLAVSFIGDTLFLPFSAWYVVTEPLVGRR